MFNSETSAKWRPICACQTSKTQSDKRTKTFSGNFRLKTRIGHKLNNEPASNGGHNQLIDQAAKFNAEKMDCDRLAAPTNCSSSSPGCRRVRRQFGKTNRKWHALAALLLVALAATSAVQAGSVHLLNKRQAEVASTLAPEVTASSATGSSPTNSAAAAEQPKPKTKIPAVNFTQVEQLYNEILDEDSVVAKWRNMDKQMVDGVRALLKVIFPHIVSMSSDAKVSGECSGAILKWILNLRNLRSWAVKMLDATGKPAAGILEGSLTMFGNYRECLSVRAPDEDEIEIVEEFREYFRGQYCVLQLKPYLPKKPQFYSLNSTIKGLLRQSYKYYEKTTYDDLSELAMAFNFVNIRADLCVPSRCSRDDIQRVADYLSKKVDMKARVQRCDMEPMEPQAGESQPLFFESDQQLIWTLVFIALIGLVLLSTLLSFMLKLRDEPQVKTKTHSLITSMSIYKSLSHMRDVQLERINDSKPVFLYTLRLLVILWICLVSLTSQLDFQFLRELLSLRDVIMFWPLQLIVNSTLQYEALIVLAAFTYSYSNINSNLTDLVKYNVGKYFRLMPSVMFLSAITIVTPLFYRYRSPVWHDFVDEPAEVCKSTGWINLSFLQNMLPYDTICLPQSWLLCVELQLSVLAIPIVYLMNKNFDQNHGRFRLHSLPILLLLVLSFAGCLINFFSIRRNSLPAAWFETFPDKQDKNFYFTEHLAKTWTHLTGFCVGLFAGHLCRCQSIATFSGRPYGRKCCNQLMLTTSGLLMLALIYSTHSWSLSGQSHLDSPLASALYAALAPLLWSLAWSMLLFYLTVPNEKNQRPSAAMLLTFDLNLIRLGRLTLLAYLINPYVNNFVYAIQEQAIFSSILMLGHTLIGNLVVTFTLAAIVSALIELPCRRLIKKLALGSRRQCSNFSIVARQLNIRHQNQGPSHDSFTSALAQQQKHQMAAAHQPMIPMR